MKKILLVADVHGWIFERHCREIKKRLSDKYYFDIAYSRGYNIRESAKSYDLAYILDPMPVSYPPKEKNIIGLRCEFLYRNNNRGALGVYEESIKDRCSIFHVVNKRQFEVFEPIVKDKPLLIVRHGIDEECFDRNKYEKKNNDQFVVGISGRPDSAGGKGFDIVDRVCKKLNINLLSTSYYSKLKKHQMPLFYKELDVYVCMSKTEGLHNPTMEAGAMGIPVITTDVGAAQEMIKDGENGFIIPRKDSILESRLLELKNNVSLRKFMSDKIYEEIMKNWTWNKRIIDFENMFNLFFKTNEKN